MPTSIAHVASRRGFRASVGYSGEEGRDGLGVPHTGRIRASMGL
jgi:hypothetical protein